MTKVFAVIGIALGVLVATGGFTVIWHAFKAVLALSASLAG